MSPVKEKYKNDLAMAAINPLYSNGFSHTASLMNSI